MSWGGRRLRRGFRALAILAPLGLGSALCAPPVARAAMPLPACGFVAGLTKMDANRRLTLHPPQDLYAAQSLAGRIQSGLQQSVATMQGCGCPRLAERLSEAQGQAEVAQYEPTMERVLQAFQRIRNSIDTAKSVLDRDSCS